MRQKDYFDEITGEIRSAKTHKFKEGDIIQFNEDGRCYQCMMTNKTSALFCKIISWYVESTECNGLEVVYDVRIKVSYKKNMIRDRHDIGYKNLYRLVPEDEIIEINPKRTIE